MFDKKCRDCPFWKDSPAINCGMGKQNPGTCFAVPTKADRHGNEPACRVYYELVERERYVALQSNGLI